MEELKRFRVKGSFFFINPTASENIQRRIDEVNKIIDFDQKVAVKKMLDDTVKIHNDPLCAGKDLDEARIRFFGGILQQFDVSVAPESILQACESLDESQDNFIDDRRYKRAKDYLLSRILRVPTCMPKRIRESCTISSVNEEETNEENTEKKEENTEKKEENTAIKEKANTK